MSSPTSRATAKDYTAARRRYGAGSDKALALLLALEDRQIAKGRRKTYSAPVRAFRNRNRARLGVRSIGRQYYKSVPAKDTYATFRPGPFAVGKTNYKLQRELRAAKQRAEAAELALVVELGKRKWSRKPRPQVVTTAPPMQTGTSVGGAPNPQGVTVAGDTDAAAQSVTLQPPTNVTTGGTMDTSTAMSPMTLLAARTVTEAGLQSPDQRVVRARTTTETVPFDFSNTIFD